MSYALQNTLRNLFSGDGSTGAATVSGAITTPKYYTALTIAVSTTLTTANFHLFASVGIVLNGTLANAGNAASGATGGTVLGNGSIAQGASSAGAAGGTGTSTVLTSVAGSNGTDYYGGSGGGGISLGGNQAQGTAGTPTTTTLFRSTFTPTSCAVGGSAMFPAFGTCAAAGQGSGDAVRAGGGGGGCAGPIFGCTPNLIGGASGAITSTGGAGGVGVAGGTAGGGGGGAGAPIIWIHDVNTGTVVTPTSNGGNAGTGQGGAGNGTTGVAGTVLALVVV